MANPKNVEKFKLAMAEKQDEVKQELANTHTYLPRWLDSTNRGATHELKRVDDRMLTSALTELPGYGQAMAEHAQQKMARVQMAANAVKTDSSISQITPSTQGKDITAPLPASTTLRTQAVGGQQRT